MTNTYLILRTFQGLPMTSYSPGERGKPPSEDSLAHQLYQWIQYGVNGEE